MVFVVQTFMSYDVSDKQVAKKEFSDRGVTSVTINSHAGMFLYTLWQIIRL